jgi:hypothetical protein
MPEPAPRTRSGPWPALLLMVLAPLLTEVLPGATRFSSMMVFPIEVVVWGGGAVLIREVVRRLGLGWAGMLLLALCLSMAEECLIQQTSLAPMVLQLNHQVYARAWGVNYVYLLWALTYESVFVVMAPVALAELVCPSRRTLPWLSRIGMAVVTGLFCVGAVLAWFSWTQIARVKVFHQPAFNPPLVAVAVAVVAILALMVVAVGPLGRRLSAAARPLSAPSAWIAGALACVWAVIWYGLVLLGFGIKPDFPPAVAVAAGVLIPLAILAVLPRWSADPRWRDGHTYAVVFGAMLGAMAISFLGFWGQLTLDTAFKIVVDLIAVGLMLWLGRRVAGRSTPGV